MAIIGSFLPHAQVVRNLATTPDGENSEIQAAVSAVLNTAIGNGLFTTTLSMVGYVSQEIQNTMNLLQALGYTVSLSGTTLTISW